MNNPVSIIGMGMAPGDLTADHLRRIMGADLLAGGRRHLEAFPEFRGETFRIRAPLTALADWLKGRGERKAVVLASGDPLYFGIGAYLADCLGRDAVEVFPNVNAVSAAFSRIKKPWENAAVISLHGRSGGLDALGRHLSRCESVAVFTDPAHGPAHVGRWLTETGWRSTAVWVCECMGTDAERVGRYTPEEAAAGSFRDPCMVVVERTRETAAVAGPMFGIPDDAIDHERGLITKQEVRAVILSLLRLSDHHVLWDLGAGSGAVSVEAGALIRSGGIVAVEKDPDRVSRIRRNLAAFGIGNARVIHADLPAGMSGLPDPDRVFIGGGGRDLAAIASRAAARLTPGGRVVISAVLVESLHAAVQALESDGLSPEVAQIQISRGRRIAGSRRLEALNPVFIVHADAADAGAKERA